MLFSLIVTFYPTGVDRLIPSTFSSFETYLSCLNCRGKNGGLTCQWKQTESLLYKSSPSIICLKSCLRLYTMHFFHLLYFFIWQPDEFFLYMLTPDLSTTTSSSSYFSKGVLLTPSKILIQSNLSWHTLTVSLAFFSSDSLDACYTAPKVSWT